MPPGPNKVSIRTCLSMEVRSARSRSRPTKTFGSAGMFPASGRPAAVRKFNVIAVVVRGDTDLEPLCHYLTWKSGNNADPDSIAVPEPAEVHHLHQRPPALARPCVARDVDRERHDGRVAGRRGEAGGPRAGRQPATVRGDQLSLSAQLGRGLVGEPDRDLAVTARRQFQMRSQAGQFGFGRLGLADRLE